VDRILKYIFYQDSFHLYTSVADPHHFDADPDPAFHFDADADPDPDPAFSQDVKKSNFF